jgi:hypothetical protein
MVMTVGPKRVGNNYVKVITNLFFYLVCAITCKKKVNVKVKCTLVQALRLCTGRTANSGSRGIALLFHDHGTRKR